MSISTVIRRFAGFSVSSIQLTGANQLKIRGKAILRQLKSNFVVGKIFLGSLGFRREFFNRVKTSVLASFFFL